MKSIRVKTFRDLMGGATGAFIVNPLQGNVVRRLTVVGDQVEVDAGGQSVWVPLDTEIRFEAWVLDRGNMLFTGGEKYPNAKLCTEADVIRRSDGTEGLVLPVETDGHYACSHLN